MGKARLKLLIIIAVSCFISSVVTAFITVSLCNSKTASYQDDSAYLKIKIIDLKTREPLENATVCIVETSKYYTTDKQGNTPTIQVPYLKNSNFDNVLERPWGDITILAYKDGYVDYLVFYIMVQKNKTRYLTLTLAPYSVGSKPYLIIESPDDAWAKEIIKKYKR
jgi:hypothetical protein